jgi:hypothetical protein
MGWNTQDHVVVLHTQTDLRYRLVDKEESNIYAYCLHMLNFQIPIQIIFNLFEIQNIHPESERNFHTPI